MSVFDDILKKVNTLNPVKSQSVATQVAPNPAGNVATGGGASTATTVTPSPAPSPAPAPAAQPQQLSYVDMINKFYTPETPEEKAKRERKEKWDKTSAAIGDGISALANLYFTTKGAPNSYDGQNTMSERTRQLYDKLDKDRKENDRWYLNYYMNAAKMDADDAYRRGRDKVADDRYEENKNYTRDRQATLDEEARQQREYQNKRQAERDAAQDANTQWQHEFQEKQANRQQANADRSFKLQKESYNRQLQKENPTIGFALGNGRKANIKKQDINPQNVSYVYNKLPKEVRDQYAQEQSYDSNGRPVTQMVDGKKVPVMKPRKLSENDMMTIIGEHISQYPDVQNAWKEVGGEITTPTPTQQSGGGGNHSHRVGGNNSTTDV